MSVTSTAAAGVLADLSKQLGDAVERAGASVVRVEGRRRQSASGVVWAADGLILTSSHVLERDEDIAVGLPDGGTVPAKLVGRDQGTDVALLRVEAQGLTPIQRGPSPRVGHLALVVARPGSTVETSIGIVSAIDGPVRTRRGGQLDGVIRTDATYFPGFSGGALIGASGELVGLATSFGGGVGLAIPLETVDRVTAALLSHGRVKRGFVGISSQPVPLPEGLRGAAGGQESGLLVVGVEAGGPAERGGVMIGDVLVALGGQPLRNTDDLLGQLGADRVGQPTPLRLFRGGEPRDLIVTIGERE
jgi:S1-C subfamily serine protease